MAIPTLSKTWQYTVNQEAGGTGVLRTDCADVLYKIKAALLGFASSHWTCWGSCDGAGNFGNNDASDRWTFDATYTKLVWAAATGTAHSWIVLKQAGLSNAQVCIDLLDGTLANYYNCALIFSPGGQFGAAGSGGTGADGTGTARPTAGDEIALLASAGTAFGADTVAFYTKGLHIMQSTDGQCTRVILCRANTAPLIWIFDKANNPIAAWTNPIMAGVRGASGASEVGTWANWSTAANMNSKIGATTITFYMTSAFYAASSVGQNQAFPDDQSGEWPINDIGLASLTAAHRGGRKGQVFDLWWGSSGQSTGATYPEDATKQLVQFGAFIFPWNGTVVKTA